MRKKLSWLIPALALSVGLPLAAQEPEEQFTVTRDGIRLTVKADTWTGVPARMDQIVPLMVTIEKTSKMPLRVRYSEFALVTPAGERNPALPPRKIDESAVTPVGTTGIVDAYGYPITGFEVAPYLRPYYPGLTPFAGPFAFDPAYYSTYYPQFVRVQLPTADMIQKALPEGVLQPGGSITGFLYFKDPDPEQMTFRAELVNANTEKQFAVVEHAIEID